MAESQILTVIRVWAAVAWADGVLAEAEGDGLRRLIRAADLSPAERSITKRFLTENVAMPDGYLLNQSPEARRGVYRAACRMAIVDRVFAHGERRILDKLQGVLGIPAEIAQEIEADVPGLVGIPG